MDMSGAFSIAKLVYKGAQAVTTGSLASIGSVAANTVMFAKRYVDSKSNEILEQVQKSEACPNIELVECTFGVPSAYAVTHVAENGGITWRRPDIGGPLVFWHPDDTFRPALCTDPLVKNSKTKLVGKASYCGPSKVCEKTENCCRRARA